MNRPSGHVPNWLRYVSESQWDDFNHILRYDWRETIRTKPLPIEEYIELPNGLEGLKEAFTDLLMRVWHEQIYQLMHEISRLKVSSPIERLLFVAHAKHAIGFGLIPQVPVGRYRIDFLAFSPPTDDDPRALFAAVECDGHDFHERTKEQAQHDKARDRYLQTEGLAVLRFSGSEIHNDAAGCVKQIQLYFDKLRPVPPAWRAV